MFDNPCSCLPIYDYDYDCVYASRLIFVPCSCPSHIPRHIIIFPAVLSLRVICLKCTYVADVYLSAMCEKQITVPSNSVLYCSERYVYLSPPDINVSVKSVDSNVFYIAAVAKTLASLSRLPHTLTQ